MHRRKPVCYECSETCLYVRLVNKLVFVVRFSFAAFSLATNLVADLVPYNTEYKISEGESKENNTEKDIEKD